MKTITEIYESIKSRFFKKTGLDIEEGTVLDSYMLSTSEGLNEAYTEIENAKNPHIYTKLAGEDLDKTGFWVNCPRVANETDESYKYRLMNWTHANEAGNTMAIELALMNLQYASSATYVPYTEGVGTATVYVIPTTYDGNGPANAIAEAKQRLSKVVSPSSYISYVTPTPEPVQIVAYVNSEDGDLDLIKENIRLKVEKYINSIPVGEFLELGEINKIGVNELGVSYFSVVQLFLNGSQMGSLKVMQKIHSKMMLDKITWWVAVA